MEKLIKGGGMKDLEVNDQWEHAGKVYILKQRLDDRACDHCVFRWEPECRIAPCSDIHEGYFVANSDTPCGEAPAKFKSDGGSSDYYKLKIKRASDGQEFDCEMGDIIYSVFGGDFDLGNIVKACRRMHLDGQGGGKDGIDAEYDAKKIEWLTKDFRQRVNKGD